MFEQEKEIEKAKEWLGKNLNSFLETLKQDKPKIYQNDTRLLGELEHALKFKRQNAEIKGGV